MTRQFKLKFLDNIPDELEEGVLYISMKYHTTAHLCACGCGEGREHDEYKGRKPS